MSRATPAELIEFVPADPAVVIDAMQGLNQRRDGWINVEPTLGADIDDIPRSPLRTLIGGKGPALPFATWVPAADPGRGGADTLGLEHGGGGKAHHTLADLGLPAPEGWKLRQDHPRRGLVYELPENADPAAVLQYAIAASTALVTVPIGDIWSAVVHLRK